MTFQSWWHFRRARFNQFLNNRARAIAAYEDVLAIEPTNALAANALGYLHGENGWTSTTSAAFDACINNSSPQSFALRKRIIGVMDDCCLELESLYLPIILAWGYNEMWVGDIFTEALLEHWIQKHKTEK